MLLREKRSLFGEVMDQCIGESIKLGKFWVPRAMMFLIMMSARYLMVALNLKFSYLTCISLLDNYLLIVSNQGKWKFLSMLGQFECRVGSCMCPLPLIIWPNFGQLISLVIHSGRQLYKVYKVDVTIRVWLLMWCSGRELITSKELRFLRGDNIIISNNVRLNNLSYIWWVDWEA